MLRLLPILLVLALWIYAFVDCLNTPEKQVRNLPKVVWALIILLFGQVLVGPLAWFLAGRPRQSAPADADGEGRGGGLGLGGGFGLGGSARQQRPKSVAPDDDPEFLASLADRLRTQEAAQPGTETEGLPDAETDSPSGSGADSTPAAGSDAPAEAGPDASSPQQSSQPDDGDERRDRD